MLSGCGSGALAPLDDRATPLDSPDAYVVQRGDTLYSIAWRHGHDHRAVARWNDIEPPYVIHPGERLRLRPKPSERRARGATGSAAASSEGESSRRASAPGDDASSRRAAASDDPEWRWPTQGDIIARFEGDAPGKKGITISGRPGQAVYASARGRVVYRGSGLIGYGKLIIVKHNDTYLSAYGHNRRILVEEGEEVRTGQRIAELGSTGADRPMLHFEIRRGGRPIDPLSRLPAQRSNRPQR